MMEFVMQIILYVHVCVKCKCAERGKIHFWTDIEFLNFEVHTRREGEDNHFQINGALLRLRLMRI